jgi:iron(III) transport system ATP-binding protein
MSLKFAIVKDAKLLLLDEPLSNLDAKLREQMRGELSDLQRRLGTTALYVTHDQEEALSLSDWIALMRDGVIVELGRPRDLYLRPRHAFTARFLGQGEMIECRSVRDSGAYLEVDTSLGTFAIDRPAERPGNPRLFIRPEHIEIVEVSRENLPNLVRGRVEGVVFSGRQVDYSVRIGDRLLGVQASSRRVQEVGDMVLLHLPTDRCILLEDAV